MEREYRIREYNGEYTIQIKTYEYSVISCMRSWFFKNTKAKEVWHNVGEDGYECYVGSSYKLSNIPLHTFKSLKEAEEKVRVFKKGIIYHNVKT